MFLGEHTAYIEAYNRQHQHVDWTKLAQTYEQTLDSKPL